MTSSLAGHQVTTAGNAGTHRPEAMMIDSSAITADVNEFTAPNQGMSVNAPQFFPQPQQALAPLQYYGPGCVPHYYPYNCPPFPQIAPNTGSWYPPFGQYQPAPFHGATNALPADG